jgi:hypothetical protein
LAYEGNNPGCAVSEQKAENKLNASRSDLNGTRAIMDSDELAAEKRTLRVLLDSFHVEQETLLEETLDDVTTRRNIGKFIGHTFVKPCGE